MKLRTTWRALSGTKSFGGAKYVQLFYYGAIRNAAIALADEAARSPSR